MESLQGIMKRVLEKRGLKHQADAAHITFSASEILKELSPELAADTEVRGLQDGVLMLETKTSSAAQACRDLIPELQRRLRSALDVSVEVRIMREMTKRQ